MDETKCLPQSIIKFNILDLQITITRSEENERTHKEERKQVGVCIRSRH